MVMMIVMVFAMLTMAMEKKTGPTKGSLDNFIQPTASVSPTTGLHFRCRAPETLKPKA